KGGMPKWLIILLVIFLVILLGCCGGFIACNWMCAHVGNMAGNVVGNAIKEGMRQNGMEFGDDLTLPANWPADVVPYAGFKAKSKVAPPGTPGGMVHFEGNESPSTVSAFYEKDLKDKGWTLESSDAGGGTTTQIFKKDKTTVTINTTPGATMKC